jgi:hypothetical protein
MAKQRNKTKNRYLMQILARFTYFLNLLYAIYCFFLLAKKPGTQVWVCKWPCPFYSFNKLARELQYALKRLIRDF